MLCISLYHIGNGGNKLFVFVFVLFVVSIFKCAAISYVVSVVILYRAAFSVLVSDWRTQITNPLIGQSSPWLTWNSERCLKSSVVVQRDISSTCWVCVLKNDAAAQLRWSPRGFWRTPGGFWGSPSARPPGHDEVNPSQIPPVINFLPFMLAKLEKLFHWGMYTFFG